MGLFRDDTQDDKYSGVEQNLHNNVEEWSSMDHEELYGFDASELGEEDYGSRDMGMTSDLTFLDLNMELAQICEGMSEEKSEFTAEDVDNDFGKAEYEEEAEFIENVQSVEKLEVIEEQEYATGQEMEQSESTELPQDMPTLVEWDAEEALGDEGYHEVMLEEVLYDEEQQQYGVNEPEEKKTTRIYGQYDTFMEKVMNKLQNMTHMDWMIVSMGAVIAVALIFIVSYATTHVGTGHVSSDALAAIGENMDSIGIIGESGLDAVTAKATERMAQTVEESMEELLAESEAKNLTGLKLNITSIDHDMKIKIVNAETDKMVSGYEFQVEVTDPKEKTEVYTDSDKDGCIKLDKLTPGKYRVALVKDDTLEQFLFSSMSISMNVKDGIDYVKVDVSDEIKKEAEVNTKVEDTAVQSEAANEVAPALQDTVEWVESAKILVSENANYKEISMDNIKSPTSAARDVVFRKVEGEAISIQTDCPTEMDVADSRDYSFQAVTTNAPEGSYVQWYVSGTIFSDIEYVGESISLTFGASSGNVAMTASLMSADNNVLAQTSYSVIIKDTVTNQREETTQTGSLTIAVGGTGTISNTEPINDEAVIWNWTSSDSSIATVSGVDGEATVTGVKVGTATIVGAATLDGKPYHTITVTVTVTGNAAVSIDATALSLTGGASATLTVTGSNMPEGATLSVEWSSSNSSIVTVQQSGAEKGKVTATVTAAKVSKSSSATIQAKAVVSNNGAKVVSETFTCTVSVTPSEAANTTSILYSKDGKQLYTVKDGAYVTAVYADYYNTSLKFYVKEEKPVYMYTGWQTLEGNTYFFDKNGNKVIGEQVILGAKYSFDNNGVLQTGVGALGIDVSKWNGNINWTAVKNSGVSYAIIRCGYRGASTGVLVEDPYYRTNVSGANNAGIKVGIYFFSQAISEAEAVEEASMCLSLANGRGITMPIFIDVESATNGRANSLSTAQRTAVVSAFCRTIQNGGYTAGVYANKTWLTSYIDTSQLGAYKIWLAQYAEKPTYSGRYNYWQYTSKGSINGISGHVDLDIKYD